MQTLIAFVILVCSANGQILRCRSCNRASTLSDCNTLVSCDATLEDCYMEELITEQLTVVYNGGCRAKDVCAKANIIGKRTELVACSRCCTYEDDCNKRLCGIVDDTMNVTQCYSCDYHSSEQSEVNNPSDCTTLDTCLGDEVCYTSQSNFGGTDSFFYGCMSKLKCSYLMKIAFKTWKTCEMNITQPENGLTWVEECGTYPSNSGKRSTALCHSCCGYRACNYGTCNEQRDRLFRLALQGKFDINTLTLV